MHRTKPVTTRSRTYLDSLRLRATHLNLLASSLEKHQGSSGISAGHAAAPRLAGKARQAIVMMRSAGDLVCRDTTAGSRSAQLRTTDTAMGALHGYREVSRAPPFRAALVAVARRVPIAMPIASRCPSRRAKSLPQSGTAARQHLAPTGKASKQDVKGSRYDS